MKASELIEHLQDYIEKLEIVKYVYMIHCAVRIHILKELLQMVILYFYISKQNKKLLKLKS